MYPTPADQPLDVATLKRVGITLGSSYLPRSNPGEVLSWESLATSTLSNEGINALALKGDLGDFLGDFIIFEICLHWKSF